MHSKSDHTEIIIKDGVGEAIKKLFDSLKNRYQNSLESVKASLFLFDYVQWWWIIYWFSWFDERKKKKNPINKKYNKYFQYTVTFALNYKETKKKNNK